MVDNGSRILPLIRELHTAHPHFTQPWYADNEGAGRMFEAFHDHMPNFLERGPPRGYLPKADQEHLGYISA